MTIEIPETCEFDLEGEDRIIVKTKTNGDVITILPHLTKEQAATLSWLANLNETLTVEIKVKV